MPEKKSSFARLIKKFFRYSIYLLLALFILANVFIVVTGRYYLYKGVANTYLIGQSGPGIYDVEIFPYKTMVPGKPISWIETDALASKKLKKKDQKYLENLGTKGFLVFHGDTLVVEQYFGEHDRNSVSNSFSAGKTIVALLIGIAIEEGSIKSLDEPLAVYMPEFSKDGKEKITIRHLLMMASGLSWHESGANPLSDNAESYYGSDLYGLTTAQTVVREPGKTFLYQSGNTQLLGFVIKKATGMSVAEYAEEKLWKRIGAESEAFWSMDREEGDEKAFCCFYASARDFARLGKLFMTDGKFGEDQVVPAWYIQEMIKLPAMLTEEGTPNQRYGLHVWVYDDGQSPMIYLRGIKGQYVFVLPEEDLLVVRVGEMRLPDVQIPQNKMLGKKTRVDYEQKAGHAGEIFEYIKIARNIVKKK